MHCGFLGFSSQQEGYRCYHPSSRHTYITIDVTFFEDEIFFSSCHNPQDETTIIEDYGGFGVVEITPHANSEPFIERDSPSRLTRLTGHEVTEHICLSGMTDQINPSGLTKHRDSPDDDARYARKSGSHVFHDVAKKKWVACLPWWCGKKWAICLPKWM